MSVNEKLRSAQHDELFEGILQLQTVEECYAFFEDICTVNELKHYRNDFKWLKCYALVIAMKRL